MRLDALSARRENCHIAEGAVLREPADAGVENALRINVRVLRGARWWMTSLRA